MKLISITFTVFITLVVFGFIGCTSTSSVAAPLKLTNKTEVSNMENKTTDDELVELALEARNHSYSPYSKYKVGAAVLAENDDGESKIFCGANMENASYPCGVCAERVAVPKAVYEGFKNIKTIAVVGSSEVICTPCGMCRQFLFEFNPNLRVLCAGSKGNYEEYALKDLLVGGFGASSM